MEEEKTRKAVRRAVNRWDPLNLVSRDMKKQYAPQVEAICKRLDPSQSDEEITEIVRDVFLSSYSEEILSRSVMVPYTNSSRAAYTKFIYGCKKVVRSVRREWTKQKHSQQEGDSLET